MDGGVRSEPHDGGPQGVGQQVEQEQQPGQCSEENGSEDCGGMRNVSVFDPRHGREGVEAKVQPQQQHQQHQHQQQQQQQQQPRRKHNHMWKAVSCDQVVAILSGTGYHSDSDEEDDVSSMPFGREIGRLWSRLKVVAAETGPAYALSYGI